MNISKIFLKLEEDGNTKIIFNTNLNHKFEEETHCQLYNLFPFLLMWTNLKKKEKWVLDVFKV